MKYLLDTHAFMWMDSEPEKLSAHVQQLCQDTENTLMLSVVSIWEMQIKNQLGKLRLNLPLAEVVREQQENGIEILPVEAAHIFALESLPNLHKDPFDRLLVAQAMAEDMVLISADPLIKQYPARVEW
jgi:PIN domain nuclease of toxin-antitoxin system